MRKLILFCIIVILAGCSPQRRLARLLERYPIPETSDTIYNDTTIYRDTTFYEQISGDTVWRDTILLIEVDLPNTELKTRSTLTEASAGIHDNTLWLELIQYEQVLEFKIDSAIRENSDTIRIETMKPYPVIEKAKPFYKNGFFILAGLILIGFVLFLLFRR